MDIESSFSRAGSIKGVAVELPFLKFKYIKIENDVSEEVAQRRINTVVNNQDESRKTYRTSTVQIVQPAQIKTMGVDPMVSSASVIHELAYGRVDKTQVMQKSGTNYYNNPESNPSRLNIIV